MQSELQTEVRNHTLIATIHRPQSLNAINFGVMKKLEQLLDRLEEDRHIRAFILTGSGDRVFVAGGDLKEFHGIKSAEEAKQMASRMGSILKRIEKLPCWTIAAINGATFGGGWEMMLAFDFRIASTKAVFDFTQGKLYLPPGWGGLTRLVEKVGRSTALRWLAETAEIDAETALRYQLIDRTATPNTVKKEALQWAEEISKTDRDFINTLKQGALNMVKLRWKAIEEELKPFTQFWEDERHHKRVEKFWEEEE